MLGGEKYILENNSPINQRSPTEQPVFFFPVSFFTHHVRKIIFTLTVEDYLTPGRDELDLLLSMYNGLYTVSGQEW